MFNSKAVPLGLEPEGARTGVVGEDHQGLEAVAHRVAARH